MSTVLELEDLKKRYGSIWALNGIDLRVGKGEVLGLLGPNGSGKTTMLKLISGLARPTDGRILINGQKPGPASKAHMAILPDVDHIYEWMTVQQAVDYVSSFYEDFDYDKARRLIELMNIETDIKVGHLSRGMNERLKLVIVISRNAELILLDEPLGGIDPTSRDKIVHAIATEYRWEDSAMIIATHLVRDIESIFDKVLFLKSGQIALYGSADELREKYNGSVEDIFKEVFA
ncbi:MAG TPA: ABC transporter ATP-binding protein [Candidatus Atribacteria bacterium]|nr:ABC transporter ATP-binding protein [Candidatus Atribacteria bacterium]